MLEFVIAVVVMVVVVIIIALFWKLVPFVILGAFLYILARKMKEASKRRAWEETHEGSYEAWQEYRKSSSQKPR